MEVWGILYCIHTYPFGTFLALARESLAFTESWIERIENDPNDRTKHWARHLRRTIAFGR